MFRYTIAVALATCLATSFGCGGGGESPTLEALDDQVVAVGSELVLVLHGMDADSKNLDYSFNSDVPDIHSRATVTRRPDGAGVFRWRPVASDVGPWFFDFTVSDGSNKDTQTIKIEVRSAVGQNSAPVFREPLGTGSTLDLAVNTCIDLNVVIEDQDSTSVNISQQDPVIEGATLTSTGGLTATWHWCPTEAQIAADDRYTLTLGADDSTNPMTIKHYLIVLRRPPKPDCPGEPPVVNHTPQDQSVLVGLTIDAQISDDQGLKAEPLLYYSTTDPGSSPDLGAMTQTSMVLISGDMLSGTWAADVPNPVAGQPMGTQATVYYVIVAGDDDDPMGNCDHVTTAPSTASYSMVVTNPGGSGGAGLCEACTSDVQCGGSSDLCVRVGVAQDTYCLKGCSGPGDCDAGYTCSDTAVESVDGAMAKQCVPDTNSCDASTACTDDNMEDNDDRTQAMANGPIAPDTYNLTSCPASEFSDDEDWFQIDVSSDAQVTVDLAGTSASDLDLGLYDSTGAYVASSGSLTSTEQVSECLTPGTYYIRVYAFSAAENNYTLTYSQTSTTCGATCTDDSAEDDDNMSQARQLAFADVYPDPYVSQTNAICADDDDWFAVNMVDGDTLTIDLTFTDADGDLDLHFYDSTGTDLTPCSESAPSTCNASQGQSATDNEHYEYTLNDAACTISSECVHYVVVHGWSGAENLYDISIALSF